MKHQTRYKTFAFYFVFISLWIVSGWNYDNADIENYIMDYDPAFANLGFEQLFNPGFSLFYSICLNFNLAFKTVHIILYGLIMYLLTTIIFRRSTKPLIVVAIYVFTAYFADIIQIKNAVALCFLYLGLLTLINDDIHNRKLKYTVITLIAATFHVGFIFYLVLLLYDKALKPQFIIIGSIMLSLFGSVIFGFITDGTLISESSMLTSRRDQYMETSSMWSMLICSSQFLLHYYVCKRLFRAAAVFDKGTEYIHLLNINLLMAFLMIFSSVNMTFFRLFRNMLLFDSIFIINAYYVIPRQYRNKALLIFYFFVMSFFNTLYSAVFDNILIILKSNYLWN